ncbi:MAG: AI-2E family transporter [Patescibacteria group bacterium]|nr:AI-2E family transporter [Patescibacteria group bacterium]MDD5043928.1 AI-2E family transporter [Patescibacteria group bacterium]MDD5490761.1 AI-2E family transporter [Patescibacteria group bacterium]
MPQEKKQITINISTAAILKVIIIFLLLGFLYLIKDILAILFVAIILASVIDPVADWGARKKIPRGVTTFVIYLLLFGIFSLVIALIVPPVVEQINQLSDNFGYLWDKVWGKVVYIFSDVKQYAGEDAILGNIQKWLQTIEGGLSKTAGGALTTLGDIFGGVVSLVLTAVIAFYMVVEEDAIKRLFRSLAPPSYQPYLVRLFTRIQQKIGLWAKGQLILSLIIFLFCFIGLSILGVNYALVLALISGLFEFVPYVGPIMAAIPAVFLAFTQSPFKAFLVVILFFVIQQLENHIIVPRVMQKAVGLNPIVSIVAILIGAKLAGVIGALLAIPVATAVGIFLSDFVSNEIPSTNVPSEENK